MHSLTQSGNHHFLTDLQFSILSAITSSVTNQGAKVAGTVLLAPLTHQGANVSGAVLLARLPLALLDVRDVAPQTCTHGLGARGVTW